jgi:hypothetical protein
LFQDNGDNVFNAADDTLVKTETTRRDGSYAFRNLAAGTYFVQQELPLRWVQTAPQAVEHDEVITPAQCGPTPLERNDAIPTAIPTGLSSAAPGTYIACGVIGDNNYHALDVDMFKVQVNAGDVLQVDIDAAAFGSPLDSILRIFDATIRLPKTTMPLAGAPIPIWSSSSTPRTPTTLVFPAFSISVTTRSSPGAEGLLRARASTRSRSKSDHNQPRIQSQ